jgi:hypothetical protein
MTRLFYVQGYQLTCTAAADSTGKFEVKLVAARSAWPSRPRVIAMERRRHETPEAAIEEGHRHGIRWVADHG